MTNDSDPDGDSLTFALTGTQTEQLGTVSRTGNTVIYTPHQNLIGTDHFTYRITDPDGASADATVTITGRAAPSSQNVLSAIPQSDGSLKVKMLGIPNRTYSVQWSENLTMWNLLLKVTAKSNGEIEFTDKPIGKRFYRISYP